MNISEEEREALDLVVSLMEQSSKWTADLTNSLMDQYKADANYARAQLKVVRIQVKKLFIDGYMPTESAIMNALYPDLNLVESIIETGNTW